MAIVTKDMIIAEVIKRHPQTEKVFKKHFGNGCFTCPGSKNEDIAFGAMMHNVDTELVMQELNDAVKGA
ncbi:DUF1858 domain-containing protein [bacterium]|nr:MAG: DUF1858 domain-containing protein [bacterium]